MDFNKELMERIWKHIDKNENGCWLSHTSIGIHGYSGITINYKFYRFHRVMLFWSNQTKVEDFNNPKRLACHSCRNRHCVNPQHLRWGDDVDNKKDMVKDGTIRNGEKNNKTKLTEQQVLEIREKYAKGNIKKVELALQYGCGKTNIGDIIKRKTWTHI
jgi:hypothetical protein